jgi:hypothetical protein
LSQKKKRREYPFVLFLEDAFGATDHPDALRDAGFEVRCFRSDFPRTSDPGKAEESVKDPRIIRHCNEKNFVLVTTDKNLCYTHIETVKKTSIVIIATQSNNEPIAVWVEALVKGKSQIERLVKHSQKDGERPCCARISKNGDLSIVENYRTRPTTRRKRPHEGQE